MKYRVSDLAKLLDVSTNTVRRYEEMGYINANRDVNSGYRYFDDNDIFEIVNARMLLKYEFNHEEIVDVLNCDLKQMIDIFEDKMEQIDNKIAYMTYVRHRMKDDYLLMKKAYEGCSVYEKMCVDQTFILYKEGDNLLNEPKRLNTLQAFLYDSPEFQRIYIIRKNDYEAGKSVLNPGWTVKTAQLGMYGIESNAYTERYESKRSVMGIARLPVQKSDAYLPDEIDDHLLKEHLVYIKEHDLKVAGDIMCIVITRVKEDGQEMLYLLVSVPVEEKCG